MGGTARAQIVEAVGYITRGGRQAFTIAEVITELERRGSQLARSTIRTHIASRMCSSAPDHHGTAYDDFERVDHGEYRWLRRAQG